MIVDFINTKSCYTMGKRKEGHSFNQIMTCSFSFATLAKARSARLHCKDILIKERNKVKTITKKYNVFKNPNYYQRTNPLFKVFGCP